MTSALLTLLVSFFSTLGGQSGKTEQRGESSCGPVTAEICGEREEMLLSKQVFVKENFDIDILRSSPIEIRPLHQYSEKTSLEEV